jgi:sec-independent protein translocase protein TatA
MIGFIIAGMLGPWQIVLIVIALLLLFGGRKIPELMKGLGQGMKEFKNATKENEKKTDKEIDSSKDEAADKE